MEESHEILLTSLAKSGVTIPPDVSKIGDLTPSMLISLCSSAIRLLNPSSTSIPTTFPDDLPISDRVKLCSDLASAFKSIGFIGDISFHNFLYPSADDLYKLVRFLVEKLPGPGEAQKDRGEKEILSQKEGPDAQINVSSLEHDNQGSIKQIEDSKLCDTRDEKNSFEVNRKIRRLKCEEELLIAELNKRSSEINSLNDDHELLKSVLNNKHPFDFYINQLNDQIEAKKKNLVEMESQWEDTTVSLEEKQRTLKESIITKLPKAFKKLEQLHTIELQTESILAETKQRDEELSKITTDFEKHSQVGPTRGSYIERVKETTKNSKKQENDILRILKETRELQIESNSIRERLHRTYMIVDETIFREAKKDAIIQQAYRYLTSIHQSFEQISENILVTDRIKREIVDYEMKLESLNSCLNFDKLKSDLEDIRKENCLLEEQLCKGD